MSPRRLQGAFLNAALAPLILIGNSNCQQMAGLLPNLPCNEWQAHRPLGGENPYLQPPVKGRPKDVVEQCAHEPGSNVLAVTFKAVTLY